LTKTQAGKSYDYREVIVFKKLRFQNVFYLHAQEKPAFSDFSGLKIELKMSVLLLWTVNKAAFLNSSGVVWAGRKFLSIKKLIKRISFNFSCENLMLHH